MIGQRRIGHDMAHDGTVVRKLEQLRSVLPDMVEGDAVEEGARQGLHDG